MVYTIFKEVSSKKMNSFLDYNERMVLKDSEGVALVEIRRVRTSHYFTLLSTCKRKEGLRIVGSFICRSIHRNYGFDQKESPTSSDGQVVEFAA